MQVAPQAGPQQGFNAVVPVNQDRKGLISGRSCYKLAISNLKEKPAVVIFAVFFTAAVLYSMSLGISTWKTCVETPNKCNSLGVPIGVSLTFAPIAAVVLCVASCLAIGLYARRNNQIEKGYQSL